MDDKRQKQLNSRVIHRRKAPEQYKKDTQRMKNELMLARTNHKEQNTPKTKQKNQLKTSTHTHITPMAEENENIT